MGKDNDMRLSGMLLPISALPSNYGIGCFSKEAYEFVDTLKNAGSPCGRFCHSDRPVTGIRRTSRSPLLPEIHILLIWRHWSRMAFWEDWNVKEQISGLEIP